MTTNNDSNLLLTPKRDNNETTLPSSSEMEELKLHMDKSIDKVLVALQTESTRRAAVEQKLHSQLLLQNEALIAMELKLLKLEAKVEGRENVRLQHNGTSVRRGLTSSTLRTSQSSANNNEAVVSTSCLDDDAEQDVSIDGSDSTPTFGSRPNFLTLDSILSKFGDASIHGESTRATRGDDGNSSLATSITGSITRGGGDASSHGRRLPEAIQYPRTTTLRGNRASHQQPRSRSQSPLTVQSRSTVASETTDNVVGSGSILTTGAVAPPKRIRSSDNPRVVSFTADVLFPQSVVAADGDGGAGDSITMPDELADNLSEVAGDTFRWREEYEARLDALQKKFSD